MLGIVSNILRFAGRTLYPAVNFRPFHAIPTSLSGNETVLHAIPNPWSLNFTRTIIRNNFPKPNEYKRLKRHGWRVKFKTKGGRREIMNRILKGRYYLSH